MVLPLIAGALGLGTTGVGLAALAQTAIPYLTGDKKKFDPWDALTILPAAYGMTQPGAFGGKVASELTKQGAKESVGTQLGTMLTEEGGKLTVPKTSIANENGFNIWKSIGELGSKDSLIPGTSNFNLAKMGLEAYLPHQQLEQATAACQKNIDAHTKKYKSKADGDVTRDYDTVRNSGACKALGIAQSKLAESQSKNISNLLQIGSNYGKHSKLSRALLGEE